MRLFRSAALATAIGLAAPVDAATVKVTGGRVLVNRGDGYRIVAGEMLAAPGATVVAEPGGSGQIVYADGCVVEVRPPTVVTVELSSPCAGTPYNLGASSERTFALGAVVVGAGVGAAILLTQKDNSASR